MSDWIKPFDQMPGPFDMVEMRIQRSGDREEVKRGHLNPKTGWFNLQDTEFLSDSQILGWRPIKRS